MHPKISIFQMDSKNYVRKWREKIAKNPQKRQEHLERERIRDKFRRERKKESLAQSVRKQLENKRQQAERKRMYRARKKEELAAKSEIEEASNYNCPQTLGKAVKKVLSALPDNASRKKEVLEKAVVVANVGIKVVLPDKPKRTPWNKTSSDTVQQIVDFYQRDDISRQAPGMKDTKSIKNSLSGKRESVQKDIW